MGESRNGKIDELRARIKDVLVSDEGQIDVDGVMTRFRETIGTAGNDIGPDALMARVKDAAGRLEGKVEAAKLREWVGEIDRDELKSWLDDMKTLGAGAASLVDEQGERLAERAPRAFDRLAGRAKEKLGSLSGDEWLISQEQVGRLKGQFKQTMASVTEIVAGEGADTTTAKSNRNKGGGG